MEVWSAFIWRRRRTEFRYGFLEFFMPFKSRLVEIWSQNWPKIWRKRDPAQSKQKKWKNSFLIYSPHHKTGTYLSFDIRRSLSNFCGFDSEHFKTTGSMNLIRNPLILTKNDLSLPSPSLGLNQPPTTVYWTFIRNPIDTTLSGYDYHSQCPKWSVFSFFSPFNFFSIFAKLQFFQKSRKMKKRKNGLRNANVDEIEYSWKSL